MKHKVTKLITILKTTKKELPKNPKKLLSLHMPLSKIY